MKRTLIILLLFGMSCSVLSQTKMFINKKNGSTDSLLLSDVKSISFKTDSSPSLQDMVPVAGGTFTAGSTLVNIGSFNMDKYEVTYELWTAVYTWGLTHGYTDLPAGQNGYNPIGSKNPVTMVNWFDIVKWCNARSEKDGLAPLYYTNNTLATVYRTGEVALGSDAVKWTANGYRLPTEAEWEFAARGGISTHGFTYSCSNIVGDVAWHGANAGVTTHPVGQKTANELGIYDMSGNVWEWCWDWHNSAYPSGGATDPKGPTSGSVRILRGGSFYDVVTLHQVAYRNSDYSLSRVNSRGFRCVQD